MPDDLTPAKPEGESDALDADVSALLAHPAMWETPDPAGADALGGQPEQDAAAEQADHRDRAGGPNGGFTIARVFAAARRRELYERLARRRF